MSAKPESIVSSKTLKNKTGAWRATMPVITEKCTGCGICVNFCPEMCIELADKKEAGKKTAKINYDYCKGCLICATECPFKAIINEKK
ncbi:MAG: 4Fe-4S binding protein [Candidatus Aenigmatarchaeota archaeon]